MAMDAKTNAKTPLESRLTRRGFVTLCGLDGAKKDARRFTQTAVRALDVFGEAADALRAFAESLCERNK